MKPPISTVTKAAHLYRGESRNFVLSGPKLVSSGSSQRPVPLDLVSLREKKYSWIQIKSHVIRIPTVWVAKLRYRN